MNDSFLKELLKDYKDGRLNDEQITERLKNLSFETLDIATLDHHRELRTGFPEVILAEGKSDDQLERIVKSRLEKGGLIYISRIVEARADNLLKKYSGGIFHKDARAVVYNEDKTKEKTGKVLVITAGTSDIPVAAEAALTASLMGSYVETMYDVGVAGIHRLLGQKEKFKNARVIIVAAGMEGALPSVVGGLVDVPVIAVPTSVGYGTSFGGLTALLGMLNSCANGVVVVNIDNGFGAGYTAALINRIGEK
ncbi:MAG: nickel pincer cofactor biosynthesis protein LarB [Acidobacteria bacterium]|nr:nickel pincer cofactor biosynthesis protein LarB [Acidobacteriota bacterium]